MISKFIFISIILFTGCFTNFQKAKVAKQSELKFHMITYNIDELDSIQSKILLNIPLHKLVFEKINTQFESNLEISLKVEDAKTNSQLHRFFWSERIISEFYTSTRNPDSYHSLIKTLNIVPGEYRYIVTITDSKNSLKWKLYENLVVERYNDISKLLPFYYGNKKIYYIDKKVPLGIDTIYFDIQFSAMSLLDSIEVSLSNQDSIFFIDNLSLSNTKNNSIVRFSLPVKSSWQGEYLYKISTESDTSSSALYFNSSSKSSLWSGDIYELVGVMNYILTYPDVKKLYEMDAEEQLEFIIDYWQINSRNQSKQSHELLLELNKRFNFTNKEFTIEGMLKGWESDRGKQYIIRGAPQKIENKYSYERSINYEVWTYHSGEKIIFFEVAMGDYKLQN